MKQSTVNTILELFERGIKATVADKFAEIAIEGERDVSLRATEIVAIGKAMGESLIKKQEFLKVPINWERFLKTKRCPKYLKDIVTYDVHAYYPNISLPKEEHWVSFDIKR